MKFITDYKTEDFILNTAWTDLPKDVQERAVQCSIDLMGALILGAQGGQYAAGVKVARRLGLYGDIPVFGQENTFNLLGAAIAFSHAANSFDIDDGYNMVKGHPGSSFVGGVLAAALEVNCTYEEYLTTLAVCYETAIRWGLAEQDHYGFLHSTGTYGAFGTAAGIGRLHGLQREKLNNALSIADYHAPLTPVMRAVEYPSMNKDGVPFGTLVGTMAVFETEAGETGRTHLLELPEYACHTATLGQRFYCRELYFKPYTCCRWAHQPILACQMLMRENNLRYTQIKHVRVHTFAAAAQLSKAVPHDTDEAQYNIAFPVASSLIYGDVGYAQVKDGALGDVEVLAMMERLEFVVDPALEVLFPEKRLAWVEIECSDGRCLRSPVCAAPGEKDDPALCLGWFTDKFQRVTAHVLSQQIQDAVLMTLTGPGTVPMRDVFAVVGYSLGKEAEHVR